MIHNLGIKQTINMLPFNLDCCWSSKFFEHERFWFFTHFSIDAFAKCLDFNRVCSRIEECIGIEYEWCFVGGFIRCCDSIDINHIFWCSCRCTICCCGNFAKCQSSCCFIELQICWTCEFSFDCESKFCIIACDCCIFSAKCFDCCVIFSNRKVGCDKRIAFALKFLRTNWNFITIRSNNLAPNNQVVRILNILRFWKFFMCKFNFCTIVWIQNIFAVAQEFYFCFQSAKGKVWKWQLIFCCCLRVNGCLVFCDKKFKIVVKFNKSIPIKFVWKFKRKPQRFGKFFNLNLFGWSIDDVFVCRMSFNCESIFASIFKNRRCCIFEFENCFATVTWNRVVKICQRIELDNIICVIWIGVKFYIGNIVFCFVFNVCNFFKFIDINCCNIAQNFIVLWQSLDGYLILSNRKKTIKWKLIVMFVAWIWPNIFVERTIDCDVIARHDSWIFVDWKPHGWFVEFKDWCTEFFNCHWWICTFQNCIFVSKIFNFDFISARNKII